MEKSINTLSLHQDYIVTGCADGTVKFYDFYFKIVAWFENLGMSSLMSVSFAATEPEAIQGYDDDELDLGKENKDKPQPFSCSPFIAQDVAGTIQICRSS